MLTQELTCGLCMDWRRDGGGGNNERRHDGGVDCDEVRENVRCSQERCMLHVLNDSVQIVECSTSSRLSHVPLVAAVIAPFLCTLSPVLNLSSPSGARTIPCLRM